MGAELPPDRDVALMARNACAKPLCLNKTSTRQYTTDAAGHGDAAGVFDRVHQMVLVLLTGAKYSGRPYVGLKRAGTG